MTAPLDLVECTHCQSWFTAASTDEVFCHATKRCGRQRGLWTSTLPLPPPKSLAAPREAKK